MSQASPTLTLRTLSEPDWRDDATRDAARMFRTLLGNIDGMVYRCLNDRDWTMEFVSDGVQHVTGYNAADLLFNQRISYESITVAEDRPKVRKAIDTALRDRTRFDVEYRIRHADGTLRWVWERGAGLYDADGRVLAIEGIVQDITLRQTTLQALHAAERRYHSLFENAIEGIFRTTPDGQYLDANPALARIYGYESPDALMEGLSDIRRQLYVDPERREKFMLEIRIRGAVVGFESQVYRRDGSIIWISENARAVLDERGLVSHYEGTVEDVTERRTYQSRIEQQANYDALTGLANRTLLHERLHQSLRTASVSNSMLAVIFVDLDHFKYINDSLGHPAGDSLLQIMSTRLRACVREGDTVARLGGDEFVLLCHCPGGAEEVPALADRILRVVAEPWSHELGEFHVTSSLGVALYPQDGREPETLLKNADAAMYRAKDIGRNTLQFFTAELNDRLTERLDLERRLRKAMERGQLGVYYQPRVDLRSGAIVGAEALLRWQVPDETPVPPARFIPIAEETGLIVELGRFVLRAACVQNQRWQDDGRQPLVVSVNVSPRQFLHDNFVDMVGDVLRETGLPARYLELEITESMVMEDAPRLIRMLGELRQLGVQTSIDDFGTGYSSLSYLRRFPVNRLKIDRSFIIDVTTNPEDAAIVRTIITLGHNLGLKVVAEGVETQAQLEFLHHNDCDEVQGYWFSKPVPAEALGARLPQLR
jgi:diguanylate cyclase (GGDEF)-like protein/PAS domain S-box-containing protein